MFLEFCLKHKVRVIITISFQRGKFMKVSLVRFFRWFLSIAGKATLRKFSLDKHKKRSPKFELVVQDCIDNTSSAT